MPVAASGQMAVMAIDALPPEPTVAQMPAAEWDMTLGLINATV